MLGKTHVAMGVATALALTMPHTVSGCLCAVAGGALGGWISDIDVREAGRAHDVWQGAVMATGIGIAALAADAYRGGDAYAYVVDHLGLQTACAVAALFVLCVVGARARHRGFTHSLVGLALFSCAVAALCAPIAPAFAAGFASHIALDLLNHQRVRVLYPFGKGFSLDICRSSGAINSFLLWLGVTMSFGLILWLMMPAS